MPPGAAKPAKRLKPGDQPTREQIFEYLKEAKRQGKKDKADMDKHVKDHVALDFPELAGVSIVRNGQTYDALDYLLDDMESYGELP